MKQKQHTQIEVLLEKLKQEFVAELPGRIQEMEELILDPGVEGQYAELYRRLHSLKGSGGTHGIEILSFTCHQMEEELERLNREDTLKEKTAINLLLEYLDILSDIHDAALNGKDSTHAIRDRLQQLRNKTMGEAIEVLIIEPSQSVSDMLSQILAGLAVNITVIDSGMNGLQLLLNRTFQVVITAYETSMLNGLSVIAAAKSLRRYQKLGLTTIVISSNRPKFESSELAPDYCLKRDIDLGDHLIGIFDNL